MRAISPLLFSILVMSCVSSSIAQTLYKTVGPDGKVSYSDMPPAGVPPASGAGKASAKTPRAPAEASSNNASTGLPDQDSFFSDLRRNSTRLVQQPDFDRAMETEKQAIAAAERATPNDPKVIQRWLAVAMAYRQQRNNTEAISVYQHVVKIADRGAEDLVLLHVYNELAASYFALGRHPQSRIYSERAAAIRNRR